MDKVRELFELLKKKYELEKRIHELRLEVAEEMTRLGLKNRTFTDGNVRVSVAVVERVKVLKKDLLPKEFVREVRMRIPDMRKIREHLKELKGIVETEKTLQIRFSESENE